MSKVVKRENRIPAVSFQWRDRTGNFHYPHEMETRHLFFVLRMIWNHSCPEELRVGGLTNRYEFGPHYSLEYMRAAVVHISAELFMRNDMQKDWKIQLQAMRDNFDSTMRGAYMSLTKQPPEQQA